MSGFFKPYEGSRPFLFVSYAHRQSDTVVATIRILHDMGWRLWYDEGIPAGSDWPSNIAEHMQNCEAVLFFLSERSLASPNCFSEMRTADRLGKPVLVIPLEDTELDDAWRSLLEGKPEIPLLADPAARADAILKSGFLKRRFRHSLLERIPWQGAALSASLLFFLAASGFLALAASGRLSPEPPEKPGIPEETPSPSPEALPTEIPVVDINGAEGYFAVRFPDVQQERAIRKALGIPEGGIYRWQLGQIAELYFCGNIETTRMENAVFDPDGTCRVNGAPVYPGQVHDLSLLESAVRLKKLALICQQPESLAPLSSHLILNELSLAGSTVPSLGAMKDLPSLAVLHLEHTNIRDLTPLDALPGLKTVTVSRDMLPLVWSSDAGYTVILVK